MQKVLVTGADGFIGSHLVEKLVLDGNQVKALVLYNSVNSWGWIDTLDKKIKDEIEVIPGDIRDPFIIKTIMKDVDTVYHLAALIAIPYSYKAPECYVQTNVQGTLNILEAARDLNVNRILITSTSEVYGTAKYVPINESHPKQAQSPYSATKIAADALAESYFKSFNLPVTIVRPFNTYGPRQSARAIIPTIITQLLNGVSEIKVGSLIPTRDFVFVKDTAEGFIRVAANSNLAGEEINIATSKEISIEALANKLIRLINPGVKLICEEKRIRPENSEVFRLLGDNKKLEEYTGWSPKYSLDEGLKETIDWFKNKENLLKYKSEIYNL
jgi:Nucleoside-diphosphate-sugar epimerases